MSILSSSGSSATCVEDYFSLVEHELNAEANKLSQRGNQSLAEAIETSSSSISVSSVFGDKRGRNAQTVIELSEEEFPNWSEHTRKIKDLMDRDPASLRSDFGQRLDETKEVLKSVYGSSYPGYSKLLLYEHFAKLVEEIKELFTTWFEKCDSKECIVGKTYVLECHLIAIQKLIKNKKFRSELDQNKF